MSRPSVDPVLVEAVTTAWRPRGQDEMAREHPAWADLPAAGRVLAYEETCVTRAIEAALDPQGWSGTVRAVLSRIRGRG